ncbi:MAG: M20/M25/M40 family metallo-hydrolase [Pseudonocardiales bacterium]
MNNGAPHSPLLVHGHLDVVPADPTAWQVPPFSGEVIDGYVWGRGAIDMKHMDAMMVALLREMARSGTQPRRDVVFAWLADEELGGRYGAGYLVAEHPDLFHGCADAISEVGGFSIEVGGGTRLYLLETAQRGLAWLRLSANGRAGHASMLHPDNAVTELAGAITRIGQHQWPQQLTPTTLPFFEELCASYGLPLTNGHLDSVVHRLGPQARFIGAMLRHTANPTRFTAGYATNVVPDRAAAEIDGRFLPGLEAEFLATLERLAGPRVHCEIIDREAALEVPFEGSLVKAMGDALRAEDPIARTVPWCLPAGTDNRIFARLGIRGYGFVPLRLPPTLDFASMFHGVDERVPEDALVFGVRVLRHLLTSY